MTYVPPIGIPAPAFGIDNIIPSLPNPWTSNQAGFYYVKQGGTNGGNGYPGDPKGLLPTSIAAGDVVVLDNTIALTYSTAPIIGFTGSSGSPSWLVSSGTVGVTSPGQATISFTGTEYIMFKGTYFILDGIDSFANTSNSVGFSLGDFSANAASNACVRNSTIRGNGQSRGSNSANIIQGGADHVTIYNSVIRDQGNYQFVGGDIDAHGMSGFGGADIWILDSQIFHNQGDGIQINFGAPNQTDTTGIQRVYIGRCLFYENLQTGLWVKNGQDIIISQNEMRNHTDGGGSAPINTGGQYAFNRVWWIYNNIHDGTSGIGIAGGTIASSDYYIVGNLIDTHTAEGMFARMGADIYIVHNMFYNYGTGFTNSPNANLNLRVENNIFWLRTGSSYDVETESTSIAEKVKNNLFPASPRFSLDSLLRTSVASMEADDPTNRHDNQSGNDPLFTDAPNANFRIATNSPAKDAGVIYSDVYATFQSLYGIDIRKDFYGVTRPQNGVWDIGATEFATDIPRKQTAFSGVTMGRALI